MAKALHSEISREFGLGTALTKSEAIVPLLLNGLPMEVDYFDYHVPISAMRTRRGHAMLRITTEEKKDFTTFRLEGKLIGDWVSEFEHCWSCAKSTEPGRRFRIDLSDVGFVDEKGKTLLERIASEGAELQANNPLMRLVVSTIFERSEMEHVHR